MMLLLFFFGFSFGLMTVKSGNPCGLMGLSPVPSASLAQPVRRHAPSWRFLYSSPWMVSHAQPDHFRLRSRLRCAENRLVEHIFRLANSAIRRPPWIESCTSATWQRHTGATVTSGLLDPRIP